MFFFNLKRESCVRLWTLFLLRKIRKKLNFKKGEIWIEGQRWKHIRVDIPSSSGSCSPFFSVCISRSSSKHPTASASWFTNVLQGILLILLSIDCCYSYEYITNNLFLVVQYMVMLIAVFCHLTHYMSLAGFRR